MKDKTIYIKKTLKYLLHKLFLYIQHHIQNKFHSEYDRFCICSFQGMVGYSDFHKPKAYYTLLNEDTIDISVQRNI